VLPFPAGAMAQTLVLAEGELHHQRRFGPETVNRGAVLLDCEWDGGVFESGAMVSGLFRSGEIRGGTFLGGLFLDGSWTGGTWERGYDRHGRYRPRTDRPPHGAPVTPAPSPSPPASDRELTVFTSTVYPDVARLWYACVRRAFPEATVEIFWDSDRPAPDASLFPGATFVLRTPVRRDYHEAYDDALARCATPYLAFTDTDVFWTCRDFWPRLRDELERDERLAAISCISRHDRPSHGTFAVILKADVYRGVRASFASAIENVDPAIPWQRWTHHSSGDLAARAVLEAGYRIKLLHLDRDGRELVRFDGITAPRRIGEHLPAAVLMTAGRYHWGGLLGNRVLAGLHDRLFPAQYQRYEMTVPAAALLREALRRSPREAVKRLRLFARCRSGARRVERFLRETA
jgi:hypothetical protein